MTWTRCRSTAKTRTGDGGPATIGPAGTDVATNRAQKKLHLNRPHDQTGRLALGNAVHSREKDHRNGGENIGPAPLELLQELRPRHSGHHEVQQDQVEARPPGKNGKCLISAQGRQDLVPVELQSHLPETQKIRVVIDDEDGLLPAWAFIHRRLFEAYLHRPILRSMPIRRRHADPVALSTIPVNDIDPLNALADTLPWRFLGQGRVRARLPKQKIGSLKQCPVEPGQGISHGAAPSHGSRTPRLRAGWRSRSARWAASRTSPRASTACSRG